MYIVDRTRTICGASNTWTAQLSRKFQVSEWIAHREGLKRRGCDNIILESITSKLQHGEGHRRRSSKAERKPRTERSVRKATKITKTHFDDINFAWKNRWRRTKLLQNWDMSVRRCPQHSICYTFVAKGELTCGVWGPVEPNLSILVMEVFHQRPLLRKLDRRDAQHQPLFIRQPIPRSLGGRSGLQERKNLQTVQNSATALRLFRPRGGQSLLG